MRWTSVTLAALCVMGWGAGRLSGQTESSFQRQQRQLEERLREELDYQPPAEQRLGVDFGGWFNFSLSLYEDSRDELRALRRYDLYLWGRAVVDQAHEFYARGRFSFLDFNTGDSPDGKDDDWQGPKVDRLFYQYDHRSAVLRREKRGLPYNAFVKVGRQYAQLGTGLALSMPMDAVILGAEACNLEVKGLFGRSIRSHDNIDHSLSVSDSMQRDFYAVQATYKGLANHQAFLYYLWQQDHTPEDPSNPIQEFDYDSEYLGLGGRGRLCLPNFYYQTELVFQRGRSFGNGATDPPDRIQALAYDLMLTYLIQNRHRPRVVFEFLYASGDDDRIGSPTDTIGGNLPGTDDHGFNGFGYRNTGLSFAPPISNLQMVRLGGAFRPCPGSRLVENLEVGADVFFYMKDESRASGPDAPSRNADMNLGQELDLFCNWRITSDLVWTLRYGVFFPGDAFSGTRSARNFLFTGLTLDF